MIQKWYMTVALIAQWSPILPLLLGLIRFKRLTQQQKLLLLMLGMALFLQFLGNLLDVSTGTNNALYHLHVVVEFTLIALIYKNEIVPILSKRIFYTIGAGFLLLALADAFIIHGLSKAPDVSRPAEALLVNFFVVLYFIRLYRDMKIANPSARFHFWFSVGNLLFFNTNLLLYIFSNFLAEQFRDVAVTLYFFHSVMVIVLYIILSYAVFIEEPDAPPPIKANS